jgi:hypothetical protein
VVDVIEEERGEKENKKEKDIEMYMKRRDGSEGKKYAEVVN